MEAGEFSHAEGGGGGGGGGHKNVGLVLTRGLEVLAILKGCAKYFRPFEGGGAQKVLPYLEGRGGGAQNVRFSHLEGPSLRIQ